MTTPDLRAALERLYDEFAAPRPRSIELCQCCEDPRRYQAILSKPLRDISFGDIDTYATSVFGTAGGLSDFRYFLPRLLELSVDYGQDERYFGPETVLGRLPNLAWEAWHKSERAAIIAFVDAWFDWVIAEVPADGSRIDELLSAMARAGKPLSPYLDKLLINLEALVAYCEYHRADIQETNRLANASWDSAPLAHDQVVAFLRTEPVVGLL